MAGRSASPRAPAWAMSRRRRPAATISLLETVLAADTERAALLAEAESHPDPHRLAEIHDRLIAIRADSAPVPRRRHPDGPRLRRRGAGAARRRVLRRLAHARGAGPRAVPRARPAAAGRADQPPRPRGHDVAGGLAAALLRRGHRGQPRPRPAGTLRRCHRASRSRQDHPLPRRLRRISCACAPSARRSRPRRTRASPPSARTSRPSSTASATRPARRARRSRRLKALERMPPIEAVVEDHVTRFAFPAPDGAAAARRLAAGRRGRL